MLVVKVVEKCLFYIVEVVEKIEYVFINGGWFVYIGVGMSGWLGVLDVFECLFIYGVLFEMVVGIIVGGEWVLCYFVEGVEDNYE